MLGSFGPLEIAIVLVVALFVFGPKRLPELGSGVGRGMREFKEGITGEKNDRGEVGAGGTPDDTHLRTSGSVETEDRAKRS